MKKDTERLPDCIIGQSGIIMAYSERMSNAERFLDAYARIEKILYEIIRETKYVPFSQMITRASRENLIISSRANDLRQYHELRNAIVHNRGKENEVIAQPCDSVTDDIEKIADLLEAKHDLLSIASAPVVTVGRNDSIADAYRLMRKMNTSKIPVYQDGVYAGLVTMDEIAGWALENRNEEDRVASILMERKNERVLFVKKNPALQVIMRSYESSLKHGMTLLAILITEHGLPKEKPLGIITVADLPKLLSLV